MFTIVIIYSHAELKLQLLWETVTVPCLLVQASTLNFHRADNPLSFKICQSAHFPAPNERPWNLSLASHRGVLQSFTAKLNHHLRCQRIGALDSIRFVTK